MIPFPYVLRRRMMVSGGSVVDGAALAPASGVTYTNGLDGLTAAEVSAMSALISNEPTITNTTQTVYVDYGNIHRKFGIANQVALALNGTNYAFDIIGFNHDTLTTATAYGGATATGKAGITLQMHDLFATKYPMMTTNQSGYGWDGSVMRASTMVTMKGYLPSAWQSIIKPVNKPSGIAASLGTTADSIKTSSDSCFLLSEVEIFGSAVQSVAGEGSQYAYYKAGNSKIKKQSGSALDWWERSPDRNDTRFFRLVSSSGTAAYMFPSQSRGVAFAFCV